MDPPLYCRFVRGGAGDNVENELGDPHWELKACEINTQRTMSKMQKTIKFNQKFV